MTTTDGRGCDKQDFPSPITLRDSVFKETKGFPFGAVSTVLALGVAVAGAMPASASGRLYVILFVLSAALALPGCVWSAMKIVAALRSPGARAGKIIGFGFAFLLNGAMMLLGAWVAFASLVQSSRGRQLRRFGKVLLPAIRENGAWAKGKIAARIDDDASRSVAAQWRQNGRSEHASVAAFARLTLDLIALGAPPELVAGANRDALDEIRHAELCFSLARALDGRSESPAPFPEPQGARTLPRNRSLALAFLAVHSLIDGALNEGVSARIIAKLTKRCRVPEITEILREIAADEGRHATHGWDVVEWCLAEGGRPVACALRGALTKLPRSIRSPLPVGARDGGWEPFGIHGHALEAQEFAKTRADIERRVLEMTSSSFATSTEAPPPGACEPTPRLGAQSEMASFSSLGDLAVPHLLLPREHGDRAARASS